MTPIHLPMYKKKATSRKTIFGLTASSIPSRGVWATHHYGMSKWSHSMRQKGPFPFPSLSRQGGTVWFSIPWIPSQGTPVRQQKQDQPCPSPRRALSWSPGTLLAGSCVRVRHNLLLSLICAFLPKPKENLSCHLSRAACRTVISAHTLQNTRVKPCHWPV